MSERTLYTWFAESVAAHPDAPSLDGEIEAVLRRQLGVREAVVVPVNATDGEVDLIAVYTGLEHPDESLLSALRSDLPLNLNGKVDRNRLVELMELVVS
jgi:hypothetical protein